MEEYTTDEVIAKPEYEIMRYAQPLYMTPSQNVEKPETKTLRCRGVYDEYALNGISIKDLDVSERHSQCEQWEGKKEARLHNLAFCAAFLLGLYRHSIAFMTTDAAATIP